jgi:DNA-binding NarL/FixJ family response regulator
MNTNKILFIRANSCSFDDLFFYNFIPKNHTDAIHSAEVFMMENLEICACIFPKVDVLLTKGATAMKECTVLLTWDDEARVWIATSEDVPGLILESGSADVLMERVRHAVPELLELSNQNQSNINLSFNTEYHTKAYA